VHIRLANKKLTDANPSSDYAEHTALLIDKLTIKTANEAAHSGNMRGHIGAVRDTRHALQLFRLASTLI